MTQILAETPSALATVSRGEQLGLTQPSGISVQDRVSKADIALAISEQAREQLESEGRELNALHRQYETEIGNLNTSINDAIIEIVNQTDLGEAKELAQALTNFTGNKHTVVAMAKPRNDLDKTVTVEVLVHSHERGEEPHTVVRSKQIRVRYTPAMNRILKEIDTTKNALAAVQQKIVRSLKDISNLPRYERKVAARLVQLTMEESAEGRDFLKKLADVSFRSNGE